MTETQPLDLFMQHGDACELLLRHAGAEVNESLVPGRIAYSDLFTHAPEAFARPDAVRDVLTKAQNYELRKNKNQFTAGEDNLILRGVVSTHVLLISSIREIHIAYHITIPLEFVWRKGMDARVRSIFTRPSRQ